MAVSLRLIRVPRQGLEPERIRMNFLKQFLYTNP